MKVIAVDDNQANCKLLSLYVNRWGYTPEVYSKSKEAYRAIREEDEPVLILMDWMMPEMSGLEIVKRIRKERPDFPIYIIMLTAKSNKEDIIEGLDSGANDYITKPFDSQELKSRIKAGIRILKLEQKLLNREEELQEVNNRLKHSLQIIEQDVQAGRKIQFKLLPENDKVYRKYKFTHSIKPSLFLSGDFLNYFKIDRDNVGFYFLDVAGHGASSSFVTVLINSFINQYLDKYRFENDRTILSPSDLFDEINKMVLEEKLEKHLTLFYGIINLTQETLFYSNAGQVPYPILASKEEGESKFLETKNLPLGLMEESEHTEKKVNIYSGDTLYLLSDGILEILEEDSLEGKSDKLLSLIDYDTDMNSLQNKINLDEYDDLPDDITLLRVKRLEE